MTKEEFLIEIKKNNIPDEWYSLNGDNSKPVWLEGKTIHYGDVGQTYCSKGNVYPIILEELLVYKEKYEFEHSINVAKINSITIHKAKSKGIISKYIGNKIWELSAIAEDDQDEELLADGFVFTYYDRYMAYYNYKKQVDNSIFISMDIAFTKNTSEEDNRVFGFNKPSLPAHIAVKIPDKIREYVINKIEETGNTQITEEAAVKVIIEFIGMDNIVKMEYEHLISFNQRIRTALYKELIRQRSEGIFDKEVLLNVYRKVTREESEYSISGSLTSRNYLVEKACIEDAINILSHNQLTEMELEVFLHKYSIDDTYSMIVEKVRQTADKFSK